MRTTLVFIILLFAAGRYADATLVSHGKEPREAPVRPATPRSDSEQRARDILMGAKDALSSGNVSFLRSHLGQRVYLNLFNGTNGYYSSDQAYLILSSFFSTWPPISFSFSSRNFSTANPYGFGPLTYERRGRRGIAELFLSLTRVGDRWVINQITVSSR